LAMTVNLRTKRSRNGVTGLRPRGERESGLRPRRMLRVVSGPEPARVTPTPTERPTLGRERSGPAPQDRALYSCSCGFVFSHDVSTSVACPHCGGTQAW
jgi:hypothetical protein